MLIEPPFGPLNVPALQPAPLLRPSRRAPARAPFAPWLANAPATPRGPRKNERIACDSCWQMVAVATSDRANASELSLMNENFELRIANVIDGIVIVVSSETIAVSIRRRAVSAEVINITFQFANHDISPNSSPLTTFRHARRCFSCLEIIVRNVMIPFDFLSLAGLCSLWHIALDCTQCEL